MLVVKQDIIMVKKNPYDCFVVSSFGLILSCLQTQQFHSYFLKVLVELYE